ncbi:MAG: hypothetical protein KME05_08200 [Gloeocapsa sp. UFS-A4-WI-NPMV-4B04]|nr:hypothetical protein [Gloeocapsa sp. UFS-A4-WI-NPMV-4B04]
MLSHLKKTHTPERCLQVCCCYDQIMEWHLDDKKVQWQQQGQVALAIFVTGEF